MAIWFRTSEEFTDNCFQLLFIYICDRIYMAIWSQRIAATLVACVAETPR